MINTFAIGLLLVTCWLSVPSEAFDEYKVNLINNADRTLELSDLGVNLTSTFNQLLSPEGIVNQFSLSIIIQIMFVVGYVVSGKYLCSEKCRCYTSQQSLVRHYVNLYSQELVFYLGLILAGLKTRFTDGPILEFLQYFDIHLSAQVI